MSEDVRLLGCEDARRGLEGLLGGERAMADLRLCNAGSKRNAGQEKAGKGNQYWVEQGKRLLVFCGDPLVVLVVSLSGFLAMPGARCQ